MLYKLTKQDGLDPLRKVVRNLTGGRDERSNPAVRTASATPPSLKKRDTMKSEDDSDFDVEDVDFKNGPVLMVDQLWLWAIDTSKFFCADGPHMCRPPDSLDSHLGNLFPEARIAAKGRHTVPAGGPAEQRL
jgi:hypothetical protein